MRGKRWVPEEDTRLTQLLQEGLSATQTARVMGIHSRCAVIGRALRLGLRFGVGRPVPPRKQPPAPKLAPPRPAKAGLAVIPHSSDILLMEQLEAQSCRFPVGDTLPFKFCGQRREKGSYCEAHWQASHQATKKLARL